MEYIDRFKVLVEKFLRVHSTYIHLITLLISIKHEYQYEVTRGPPMTCFWQLSNLERLFRTASIAYRPK